MEKNEEVKKCPYCGKEIKDEKGGYLPYCSYHCYVWGTGLWVSLYL